MLPIPEKMWYAFSDKKNDIYDITNMQCYIIMTFVKIVSADQLQNIFKACPPWFCKMYINVCRWSKYDQNMQHTLLNIIKLLYLTEIYNLLSGNCNTR